MATAIPFGWTVQNAAGTAVSGAKIYFYVPNTTTNRTPFSDTGLSVPTANPVVADAAGYFLVYLSSELAYDIVVKSADDSITYQSRTVASNIAGAQPVDATLTALAALGLENRKLTRGTGVDTGALIFSGDLFDFVNVKDYGATGNGSTDDTTAITAAITAAGTGGAVFFPKGVYIFSTVLTQLSGQRWFGAGRAVSILRLRSTVTSINVCVTASDFATDYSIEDLQIDGNRANITPSSDLFNTFYLVRGPRGGKRGLYRNLLLSNSWGRVLQTSDETQTEYAEDVTVDNVCVTNAGTKAISVTRTKRATVNGCHVEVDPYSAAENTGGGADASSGSCYEVNESEDVVISNNHGVQVGASIEAPGIRLINGSSGIRVFGNTINDASYLGFIQNVSDVDFFGNIGRVTRNSAILIADSDVLQPTTPCKRIRVHHNTVIDCDDAYVFITGNKDGYSVDVECYVYENEFVQVSGSPTFGIYNEGVISPATGGTVTVYEWGNRYTGTIPNRRAGPAAHQIQQQPDTGFRVLAQSSVAVSHTGSVTETTLATITVPADTMGNNGRLRITAHWSYTNDASNKITRIRFNGSQLVSATNTTTAQQRQQIELANQNSLSAQIVSIPGAPTGFGTTTTAILTHTIDTSADRNITITGELADTADTITLQSYVVEILHGL
jgi:hypothetical protein